MTKELELVKWEHAAESVVSAEVVDDMSGRWSQMNADSQVRIFHHTNVVHMHNVYFVFVMSM